MRKLFLLLVLPTLVQAQSYSLPGYDWTYLLCDPANSTLSDEVYLSVCGVERPAVAGSEPITPPLDPEPEALSSPVSTPPQDPPVILELSPSEQWIPRSGSVTLSWQSTGATSCTASGDWSGTKPVSGVVSMEALTEDKTYTLVCENGTNTSVALLNVHIRQAVLTWEPPTANTDGSPLPLSDIDSYRVYWGTASRAYENTRDVEDVEDRSLVLELPPGTYYFAMTAINTEGNESAFSAEGWKEIN